MRSFARVFGRAELDMHFSLSKDLIPLKQFLAPSAQAGHNEYFNGTRGLLAGC